MNNIAFKIKHLDDIYDINGSILSIGDIVKLNVDTLRVNGIVSYIPHSTEWIDDYTISTENASLITIVNT